MQAYFRHFLKFLCLSRCKTPIFCILLCRLLLSPQNPAGRTAAGMLSSIHHDHIRSNAQDAFPGYLQILIPSQKPKAMAAPMQNHRLDLCRRAVKTDVIYSAEVLPCFVLDHIFPAQITQRHLSHPRPQASDFMIAYTIILRCHAFVPCDR